MTASITETQERIVRRLREEGSGLSAPALYAIAHVMAEELERLSTTDHTHRTEHGDHVGPSEETPHPPSI